MHLTTCSYCVYGVLSVAPCIDPFSVSKHDDVFCGQSVKWKQKNSLNTLVNAKYCWLVCLTMAEENSTFSQCSHSLSRIASVC